MPITATRTVVVTITATANTRAGAVDAVNESTDRLHEHVYAANEPGDPFATGAVLSYDDSPVSVIAPATMRASGVVISLAAAEHRAAWLASVEAADANRKTARREYAAFVEAFRADNGRPPLYEDYPEDWAFPKSF